MFIAALLITENCKQLNVTDRRADTPVVVYSYNVIVHNN